MTYKTRFNDLKPYDPIEGSYKIRLDANESFIKLPNTMYKKALSVKLNRYPSHNALQLCESFCQYYSLDVNNVVAYNGSDEAIGLIISTLFVESDKILTLSNDFSMYALYCKIYNVGNVIFNKNDDLDFSIDDLINYINNNEIAGVILSNPCNPTSLCKDRDEIIKLISSVKALVVIDEAYMDFYDQTILDIVNKYDNLIVLKTCSKAIGLAGIRLGFSVANEDITRILMTVKAPYNVNSLTQSIGCMVLSDFDYIDRCIACLQHSCKALEKGIRSISGPLYIYKSTTNFVFIKTKFAKSIYEKLLSKGIAVRCFDGFLRITCGNRYENSALLREMKKIVGELV